MATQIVQPLQSQVQLDATVGVAPFQNTFDNAALTPTALGEFGARLAIGASATLAQKRGYEAGMDPHGTLLPPLTATDKAFADAYITQAQNTLGLQATKLMQEGQSELAKAWRLTPDMIASYTQNMSDGLNQIINNAPLQAQPGLQAQFSSSLMRTTGALNQKMIGQQKEQALQNATLYNNSQLSSIYESARSGQIDAAKKMYESTIERSKSMLSTGMITPLQADSTQKSARISYYTGVYTGQALQAYHAKKADQFLADLLDKKPTDVTTLEWESIARNVMGEIQTAESFQQRNETSLYSEANRLLSEGGLTSEFISQLESQTTSKPRFNEFMAHVAAFNRKNYATNQKVSSLMPEWGNAYSMAIADNKTKDAALVQAASDIQQRAGDLGRTIDNFQAETEAMSTAGGPIASYTKKLNAGFLSGNPELMLRNLNAYRTLRNSNAKVLNDMDNKALAMMTNFESQMEDGNAPEIAAQKAYEVVQQKTPEQMEINDALIRDWERTKVNTPSRLNSWASQFADIGEGAQINNLPYFAQHVKNIFKSNMAYLNGDIEGATKMTREGIQRSWGVTEVNGNKEFVFQPVETSIGLDAGANPLIKQDLYEQLQAQIKPMNDAYEEGKKNNDHRLSFYYRLPPRPTYDDYKKAKEYVSKKSKAPESISHISGTPFAPIPTTSVTVDQDFEKAIDSIKAFTEGNVTIEKVYDSGKVEKFEVAIGANPGLQQDAQGMIGSYNVSIKQNDGPTFPMNGWFRGPLSEPIYLPRANQIRQRYFELVGLNPTGKTTAQIYEEWVARKKSRENLKVDDSIARLGRSFR